MEEIVCDTFAMVADNREDPYLAGPLFVPFIVKAFEQLRDEESAEQKSFTNAQKPMWHLNVRSAMRP